MREREGCRFRATINADASFRVLKKSRPGMIVLELKMPGMSGLELLDVMGKNPAWARIPVVIVTSMDITQEMRDVLAARTLGILRKGQFTREQLADHIRPALQACALAEA